MSSTSQNYGQITPEAIPIEQTAQNATPTAKGILIPEGSALHDLLAFADNLNDVRTMFRSWYISHVLDKNSNNGAEAIHTGTASENALMFEAVDQFLSDLVF